MSDELPPPPRVVRPRNRKYARLPVIALSGSEWLDEEGRSGPIEDVISNLAAYSSTLFVKLAASDFIAELDELYRREYPDTWQFEISTHERGIISPNGVKVAARVTVPVKRFGFKTGNYHKIIDPVVMYGQKLKSGDDIHSLLEWGVTLRDFCHENMMDVRPTIGAISAQFLTDRRFYPDARRKVPRKINDRAREHQPGNHYVLTVQPSPKREFTALYIDQTRAHHYHARTVELPASNSLYAHGRFIDLAEIVFDDVDDGFYGLYCLDLDVPTTGRRSQWITHGERQFVYSNEVPHLRDMGYNIRGVRAAWGSYERDEGLPRYATWAESQLDRYQNASWLKPLLLATYGMLAARATDRTSIWRLVSKGEDVTVPTGRRTLAGKLIRAPHKLEPRVANVLHRGMIEAATRSESVGLAQWLTHKGFYVLSIYADAVIIRDDEDKQLPALPEPWRIQQKLNHLQFINQQAFISGEMTKLPGVSQELRAFARNSTGHAPRAPRYDAMSGRRLSTKELRARGLTEARI